MWRFKVPVLLDEAVVPQPKEDHWVGFKEIEKCPYVVLRKKWGRWYLRPQSGNFGEDERLEDNVPYVVREEYYEETDNPLTLGEMIKKFPADKVIQYCVERGMKIAVK